MPSRGSERPHVGHRARTRKSEKRVVSFDKSRLQHLENFNVARGSLGRIACVIATQEDAIVVKERTGRDVRAETRVLFVKGHSAYNLLARMHAEQYKSTAIGATQCCQIMRRRIDRSFGRGGHELEPFAVAAFGQYFTSIVSPHRKSTQRKVLAASLQLEPNVAQHVSDKSCTFAGLLASPNQPWSSSW